MRLLVDMNLTPRWTEFLQAAGIETVHWSTVGDGAAPDATICAYAHEKGFAVLTNDLDFPVILAHA